MFKQYILNMNRNYLYGNDDTYGVLSYLYAEKRIDNLTLNKIINSLITTNTRDFKSDKKEYFVNLDLCENYLSYMAVAKDYYLVLVPYTNFEIRFANYV